MKTKCDNCKSEFEMSQDKLKEKYLGAMYIELYGNCPICNKKHLVCIMNAKSRKLKRSLENEIKIKLAIINNVESIIQDEKINDIQKELHNEMYRINDKA